MNKYTAKYSSLKSNFDKLWNSLDKPKIIKRPKSILYYMKPYRNNDYEGMYVIFLDNALRVINHTMISKGSGNVCTVSVKDIMSAVLKSGAHNFVLCHNHPSGNLDISDLDLDFTKTIKDASKLLEIGFLDHIVFSYNGFKSIFTEYGKEFLSD